MKTFSKIAIALCSTATVAVAQPAPAAKTAPAPAPAAGKAAPAAPAKDAKPTAGAPAIAPVPTKAEPPAPPKPPAELAAHIKAATGTWRCTGTMPNPDGSSTPLKATQKTKGDLEGWWAQDVYEGAAGPMKYKFTAYTTYDAGSKKWRRFQVDNMGGQMMGTSDGPKDNKIDYNLDSISPMGSGQFRIHIDQTDPKAIKNWGEASIDKGKNWMKVYEMTCKK